MIRLGTVHSRRHTQPCGRKTYFVIEYTRRGQGPGILPKLNVSSVQMVFPGFNSAI